MKLPDELVERAAKAQYERWYTGTTNAWDAQPEWLRNEWRDQARAGLKAALSEGEVLETCSERLHPLYLHVDWPGRYLVIRLESKE